MLAVTKLSVPISSFLPQRPQFLRRFAAAWTSLRVSRRCFLSIVFLIFGMRAAIASSLDSVLLESAPQKRAGDVESYSISAQRDSCRARPCVMPAGLYSGL